MAQRGKEQVLYRVRISESLDSKAASLESEEEKGVDLEEESVALGIVVEEERENGVYSTTSDELPNPITEGWSAEDSSILMILWNAMESDILSTVHTFKTTKKFWNHLQATYPGKKSYYTMFKKIDDEMNELFPYSSDPVAYEKLREQSTVPSPEATYHLLREMFPSKKSTAPPMTENSALIASDKEVHCQLGHPSLPVLKKIRPEFQSISELVCKSCIQGKHVCAPYPPSQSNSPFALLHSDVWSLCRDHESCASPTPTPPQNSELEQPVVLPPNPDPAPPPPPPTFTFPLLSEKSHGVDYEETFFPIVKMMSVRIFIALAIMRRWTLHQLDLKNAFLNGILEEKVYMTQSSGSASDYSVFYRHLQEKTIILVAYVDDLIITDDDAEGISALKKFLSEQFQITDWASSSISLILWLLRYKSADSPMVPDITLMSEDGEPLYDPERYRRLIGKLNYLTVIRPDIAYPVNVVSQFMSVPHTTHWDATHWDAVLQILRYLKRSSGKRLVYSDQGHSRIVAFTDADWTGYSTSRRSTTGYCVFFGAMLVSWKSKKQTIVSRFSTESEYQVMTNTSCELVWTKRLLDEIVVRQDSQMKLHCDNQAAMHITKNQMMLLFGAGVTTPDLDWCMDGQLGFDGENMSMPRRLGNFLEINSSRTIGNEAQAKHIVPSKISAVKAGGMMSLAIDNLGGPLDLGQLPSAKYNKYGQLGLGDMKSSCRCTNYVLDFWPRENGQLGLGNTLSASTPAPIRSLPEDMYFVPVDCGLHHTSIVSTAGDVWSWRMERGLGLCPNACFTGTDSGDAITPLLIPCNRAHGPRFPEPVQVVWSCPHCSRSK
ncbi:Retrovirus-related Pol polyprotein from transposon RE1-like protein [Drosera capensis]